jgi:hypothetical protein
MKTNYIKNIRFLSAVAAATLATNIAASSSPEPQEPLYSPYVTQTFPDQVFFGDTHLHTSYSADSGLAFSTTTPDDAYRFAKGEVVTSSLGVPSRLQRPLDFLVVSEHAENLGIAIALEEENPVLLKSEWGRMLLETYKPKTLKARTETFLKLFAATHNTQGKDPLGDIGLTDIMWKKVTQAAEDHNQPGKFTALIGYEWTSAPDGNNLHRNVIFRDGKDKTDKVVPISSYDSKDPEDLWAWMESYEQSTGGKDLAIPHNGNISNGLMFDDVTLSGEKLTADYAKRRQRWEPLYEVTQIKGDSETHPFTSPNDEFANYYRWDKGSFGIEPKSTAMLPREYARSALKRGLQYEAKLGANPFKFGLVGSTDSHTGLSTAQEDNFFGKITIAEPTKEGGLLGGRLGAQVTGVKTPLKPEDDQFTKSSAASGIAAVWAKENTREALWDAMQRKEVYATTGTRLRVRVFAGWDFTHDDLNRPDFARYGYEQGVPMGGNLSHSVENQSPRFLVRALRDTDGANLDRIQIVKGWVSQDGEAKEKIYNIAWSGDRKKDTKGNIPPVGNTVNTSNATYSNSIGSNFLQGFWQDPDFNPEQRAFYYARVLEIPTPSWLLYDSISLGSKIPDDETIIQQERAYTSPIWYTPRQ